MTPQTEIVLKQIIKGDESISPENAIRALALFRNPSSPSEPTCILPIPKVLEMLSIKRGGLYEYFRLGLLKRIYGIGGKAIGVSQDSYIAFTSRRPERIASK